MVALPVSLLFVRALVCRVVCMMFAWSLASGLCCLPLLPNVDDCGSLHRKKKKKKK